MNIKFKSETFARKLIRKIMQNVSKIMMKVKSGKTKVKKTEKANYFYNYLHYTYLNIHTRIC